MGKCGEDSDGDQDDDRRPASYQPKDNRVAIPIAIFFGGERYQTPRRSLDGFRGRGCKGKLLLGQEAKLDGVDFDVENISSPSVNCTVVRFHEGRLAASLLGLALRPYNALASPMMRRGK